MISTIFSKSLEKQQRGTVQSRGIGCRTSVSSDLCTCYGIGMDNDTSWDGHGEESRSPDESKGVGRGSEKGQRIVAPAAM